MLVEWINHRYHSNIMFTFFYPAQKILFQLHMTSLGMGKQTLKMWYLCQMSFNLSSYHLLDCHKWLTLNVSHELWSTHQHFAWSFYFRLFEINQLLLWTVIKKLSHKILKMGYAWHAQWWYKMPHTTTL